MTQNIEQRTLAATATMEGAAKAVDEIAHTDKVVATAVGERKSFPKISREWDEKATELKTTWENDSATLRQDWQNERNELSTKALGVKPWEPGVSESNFNQQRRWDDGHTYLPKAVPAVMDVGGPDDNWIPYTADKSDTLNDVFGLKPIDLIIGTVLVPDVKSNYPKLNALGKVWELDDGDRHLTVKAFSETADEHLIVTLDDDSLIIASRVVAASREYVNSITGIRQKALSGGLKQLDLKRGQYGQQADGVDRVSLDDETYWFAWDAPSGTITNFVVNNDYGTATMECELADASIVYFEFVSPSIDTLREQGDIRGFGAVSGSDCTNAIDAMVATGKKVLVKEDMHALYSGSLKVAGNKVQLDGIIDFVDNVDGLILQHENTLVRGMGSVICSHPSYSKAPVLHLADDAYPVARNNICDIGTIEVINDTFKGKCTHFLAGVGENQTRQSITSCKTIASRVSGAAYAVLYECNASPTSEVGKTNYVNANYTEIQFISKCARAVHSRCPKIDSEGDMVGETSSNVTKVYGGYQCGDWSVPPLVNFQGDGNEFDGDIWDYKAIHFPLVEFSIQPNTHPNNQSIRNKVILRSGYSNDTDQPLKTNGAIIDPFVDNEVITQNDMGMRQHLVSLNASKRTLRNEATSFLGKVENWLAYANRKWGSSAISFKKNGVDHVKDVNNAFNNIGGAYFTLNHDTDITDAVNDRFELQVLWPNSEAVQTSFAGALFNQQMIKYMRVDLIKTDGSEVTLYTATTMYSPFVINERPQAISDVRGVRFTFGDFVDDFIPNQSTANVQIGSFFLSTTNQEDSYFMTKSGGKMYGNVEFLPYFSPIMTDEVTGKKWRLRAFGDTEPAWVEE